LIPEPPPPPPPKPQLVAIHRHDLQFEWNSEPDQQYRVQIARDAKFQRILSDQTVSDGKLTWHRPWPGTYYIRVNQAEAIPFTVPVPLWMRIAAPIVILTPLLF
jgi:hypothetical protein